VYSPHSCSISPPSQTINTQRFKKKQKDENKHKSVSHDCIVFDLACQGQGRETALVGNGFPNQ